MVAVPNPAEAATTLAVSGVFTRAIPDAALRADGSTTGATGQGAASVRIGSTLVPVPDQPAIPAGSQVRLTLKAPVGYTAQRAVSTLAPRPERPAIPTSPVSIANIEAEIANSEARAAVSAAAETTAIGNHTVTVVPVYWGGETDGATRASLTTMAEKLRDYWQEQSSNRIKITGTTVKDWKKISAPSTCDVNAIYNAAVSAHGLPGANGNDHYVIYFPTAKMCDWSGMGSVSGPIIWNNGFWKPGYEHEDVLAHEFGHNIGVVHANVMPCTDGAQRVPMRTSASTSCTHQEYGDYSDVMGGGYTAVTVSINVAFAHYLGLAEVATAVSGVPLTVTLPPLTSFGKVRGIRIPLRDGTALYVELRPATGRDTAKPEWAGVQIRRWLPDGTDKPRSTELLDMQPDTDSAYTHANMPAGSRFRVPNENFIIEVGSVSDTAATVSVLPVVSNPTGTGRIIGMDGKCIGLANGNTTSGTPVDVYSCNGSQTQKWTVASDLSIQNSGLCLDVTDGRTDDGAPVLGSSCRGTSAQQWVYTDKGQLRNVKSGMCLDMEGNSSADFTRTQIWTCTGGANQKWTVNA